jgi:hypothetical protein
VIRRNSNTATLVLHLTKQIEGIGAADLTGGVAIGEDALRIDGVQAPPLGQINGGLVIANENPGRFSGFEQIDHLSLAEVQCGRLVWRSSEAAADLFDPY